MDQVKGIVYHVLLKISCLFFTLDAISFPLVLSVNSHLAFRDVLLNQEKQA